MNLLEILRSATGPRLPGAPGSRDRSPKHRPDSARTADWNAWRERQALHPRGHVIPAGRATPNKSLTASERRARRTSTRASRRRASRQAADR